MSVYNHRKKRTQDKTFTLLSGITMFLSYVLKFISLPFRTLRPMKFYFLITIKLLILRFGTRKFNVNELFIKELFFLGMLKIIKSNMKMLVRMFRRTWLIQSTLTFSSKDSLLIGDRWRVWWKKPSEMVRI